MRLHKDLPGEKSLELVYRAKTLEEVEDEEEKEDAEKIRKIKTPHRNTNLTVGSKDTEKMQEEKEENEDELYEKDPEKGDEPEGKDDDKAIIEVAITVKKKDRSGLLFDCGIYQKGFQISRVAFSSNVEKSLKLLKAEKLDREFAGPEFLALSDPLREAFVQYLEALGVNDRAIAFVECSSLDQEQKLYVKWLSEVGKFVAES